VPNDYRQKGLPVTQIPDLYWYKATVSRAWSDGDTVTVCIDYGRDHREDKVKLRLARIDAFGRLATGKDHPLKAKAVEFCNFMLPVGKEFFLQSVKDKSEKWGRFLAEVWIQADDLPGLMNFNDILVMQGLALYWEGQGEHPTGEVTHS
jgi:endonuclease YncB( thermonuclease family)